MSASEDGSSSETSVDGSPDSQRPPPIPRTVQDTQHPTSIDAAGASGLDVYQYCPTTWSPDELSPLGASAFNRISAVRSSATALESGGLLKEGQMAWPDSDVYINLTRDKGIDHAAEPDCAEIVSQGWLNALRTLLEPEDPAEELATRLRSGPVGIIPCIDGMIMLIRAGYLTFLSLSGLFDSLAAAINFLQDRNSNQHQPVGSPAFVQPTSPSSSNKRKHSALDPTGEVAPASVGSDTAGVHTPLSSRVDGDHPEPHSDPNGVSLMMDPDGSGGWDLPPGTACQFGDEGEEFVIFPNAINRDVVPINPTTARLTKLENELMHTVVGKSVRYDNYAVRLFANATNHVYDTSHEIFSQMKRGEVTLTRVRSGWNQHQSECKADVYARRQRGGKSSTLIFRSITCILIHQFAWHRNHHQH